MFWELQLQKNWNECFLRQQSEEVELKVKNPLDSVFTEHDETEDDTDHEGDRLTRSIIRALARGSKRYLKLQTTTIQVILCIVHRFTWIAIIILIWNLS